MYRILSVEEVEDHRKRSGSREKQTESAFRRLSVRLTLENGETFLLRGRRAAAAVELGADEVLPEDFYTEILQETAAACMQRCGMLLGARDYSEHRLREKLTAAGFPASIIEQSLGKLRDAGYLNDARFARSYLRSHLRDRSRMRIVRDLTERGISEADIENAFAAVSEEEDLESVQLQQISRLLEKRRFDPDTASYEEKQKTMAFLHRKGYPAALIRRAMDLQTGRS